MVKVKLLPNQRKEWVLSLMASLRQFLPANGIGITESTADVSLCIGGDGTIFHNFHLGKIRGSILGIGSKTSSVCQFQHEKLNRSEFIRAIKKNKTVSRLSILAKSPPLKKSIFAINDVVVHSHDYRVIKITVSVGKKKQVFEGDGIIVSTPLGTTGYAYSAGGSILPKSGRQIEVVPICPYMRTMKSFTAKETDRIVISTDRSADLIIDGIYYGRLKPEEKTIVRKGKDIKFLEI